MADHPPPRHRLNSPSPSARQIAAIFVGVLLIALLIALVWTSSLHGGSGVARRGGAFREVLRDG